MSSLAEMRLKERYLAKGKWRYKYITPSGAELTQFELEFPETSKQKERELLQAFGDHLASDKPHKNYGGFDIRTAGEWEQGKPESIEERKDLLAKYTYDISLEFGAEFWSIDWEGRETKPCIEFRKKFGDPVIFLTGEVSKDTYINFSKMVHKYKAECNQPPTRRPQHDYAWVLPIGFPYKRFLKELITNFDVDYKIPPFMQHKFWG